MATSAPSGLAPHPPSPNKDGLCEDDDASSALDSGTPRSEVADLGHQDLAPGQKPWVPRRLIPQDTAEKDEQEMGNEDAPWMPLVMLATIVLVVLVAISFFGWENAFRFVFDTVHDTDAKLLQAVIINGLCVFVTVACLPAPMYFLILNGLLFGFWRGWVYGFCATVTSALLARALARSSMKAWARRRILSHPATREVLQVLDEEPTGKFLVLFRFLLVPGFVKNYTLGMLDISLLKFVLVCAPGELFYTGIFAYIGSKALVVASKLRDGDTGAVTSLFSGLEIGMLLLSVLVFLILATMAWLEYQKRKARLESSTSEREPLVSHASAGV